MTNKEVNEYIKSDLFRYCGKTGTKAFFKVYFSVPAFRFLVPFRMKKGDSLYRKIGHILWIFCKQKQKIQIIPGTQIGYGLFIGHDGPVVVHPTAVIGNNVNLSQFVTIGSNNGKAATIGDNVYIGPSVCVVEDVKIGDNATIGAGSVVTKDIPENATAVGNYAKVINYNNPGQYSMNNRWNCSKEK